MPLFVLDTNLFLAADRDMGWAEELELFSSAHLPFIHFHAVVAQELLAGALDRRRQRLLEESLISPFVRRGRLLTPSFSAWMAAGRIVSRLVESGSMSPGGFKRSFLNDCVLAASCREAGATLVTQNLADFELIQAVHSFEFAGPWPD